MQPDCSSYQEIILINCSTGDLPKKSKISIQKCNRDSKPAIVILYISYLKLLAYSQHMYVTILIYFVFPRAYMISHTLPLSNNNKK